jgi:iron complex outermembrane receptor protein
MDTKMIDGILPTGRSGMLILQFLFLVLCGPAWAGEQIDQDKNQGALMEMEIETLTRIKVATVTGASKYEQKVTEAPSSVSIITADEIRKYGHRTLADVLRSARGFYVTYDRAYSFVGVRGFNRPGDWDDRVLLLVDGHRMNENVYNGAFVGTEFPVDIDLIDRVEIIRGPGSSLYGSNAFFGVINVIMKQGRDLKGTEVSGEAASFDTYKGRLSYGDRFQNGLEVLLSGTGYDSKGQRRLYYKEFDSPATNNGIAQDLDYNRSKSFFSKFSFNDFTLTGAYGSRTKGIPTGEYGAVFNASPAYNRDDHAYADLRYAHSFYGRYDVSARVYYDNVNAPAEMAFDLANYDNTNPVNPPSPNVEKYATGGRWWGAEAQLGAKVFEKHHVTAGVNYEDNLSQYVSTYYEDPYIPGIDINRNSTIWALYLQDEYHLSEQVMLNAGARYDHYDTIGGTTNPRLALIYRPVKTTSIKFLYGTAFRAPNLYEVYYEFPGYQKINPDLKPETIKTYELVYEQYLGDHLRSSLSGFYYTINDLISALTDPADNLLQYRNINKAEAKGVEAELEGKWPSGIHGRISYTLLQAKDLQTGEILTNSPEHMAKLNVIVPLLKEKFFEGTEVQYMGRRKTVAGNYADDFVVVNITLFGRELVKGLDASATVYNVFDTKYGDPVAGIPDHAQDVIEQDGRTFRVKLTYHF